MEADLRNIVEEFSDIVEIIEKLEISEEEQVSKLKARLNLCDGTILWVREIRLKKVMQAYSYYWLRPDQTIIVGWDNAPHHKEVKSFPRRPLAALVRDAENTDGRVFSLAVERTANEKLRCPSGKRNLALRATSVVKNHTRNIQGKRKNKENSPPRTPRSAKKR